MDEDYLGYTPYHDLKIKKALPKDFDEYYVYFGDAKIFILNLKDLGLLYSEEKPTKEGFKDWLFKQGLFTSVLKKSVLEEYKEEYKRLIDSNSKKVHLQNFQTKKIKDLSYPERFTAEMLYMIDYIDISEVPLSSFK